ncbi:hypothetical protein C8Q80DRAFT_695953 [Daedaleopsis nitida]|nr:hypothetical protein C8Q80DRAFT_695953 [Daedaleopsis nitida]
MIDTFSKWSVASTMAGWGDHTGFPAWLQDTPTIPTSECSPAYHSSGSRSLTRPHESKNIGTSRGSETPRDHAPNISSPFTRGNDVPSFLRKECAADRLVAAR